MEYPFALSTQSVFTNTICNARFGGMDSVYGMDASFL